MLSWEIECLLLSLCSLDGFRKVKSASLQNPNWWEFRHANFIRGKPDLMSEIKRSMHFVPDSFGGSKEISDLKMQVATLTERLNFLNDQVEKLTGNFGGMGMKTEKNKKRKISATESTNQPIELRRMNSLGSNYADEMKSSGLPVPVGEELENFDWEEMAVDEEEDTPQPGDEEEFFELVGDLAEMEEANKTVMEKETPAPIIQSIPAESVADTSFSEVSSVIDKLPSDLQLRFVDKLAEVVGLQLSAAMNSQKLPIVKAEPYPDAQPVHPVSSYPAYVLPSGSKAPEIALPLASAAISAFLMSHLRSIPASQGVSSVPVAEQLGAK